MKYIVIFTLVWWCVFFMILPFGVKQEENHQIGNDPGSPKKSHIKLKAIITTIISSILVILIYLMIKYGYFDFLNLRGNI